MRNLSSRERILAAMNLQQPDRVPLMCQFSIGSMMTHLKPNPYEFWYDKNVFAEGLVRLCDMFKFDGILVSLHGHSEKWKKDLFTCELIEEGNYKLTWSDRTEVHSWTDLPMVSFKHRNAIKMIEDIDIELDIPSEINYIPVSQNLYFDLDKDSMAPMVTKERLLMLSDLVEKYGIYETGPDQSG